MKDHQMLMLISAIVIAPNLDKQQSKKGSIIFAVLALILVILEKFA